MLRLHDEASNCVTSGLNKRHSGDAARCVSTMRVEVHYRQGRGSGMVETQHAGDAACRKLVQISFAEMVLKGHGFSASGAVPSAQTWNRASAPAPFPNLERVPQRLK